MTNYYVTYHHPNGDFFVSPHYSLEELKAIAKEEGAVFNDDLFIDLMKQNFNSRKSIRESNIQIIKEIDSIGTVIYEQKRF